MSCSNCGVVSNGGYRHLCDYNGVGKCTPHPPHNKYSYDCEGLGYGSGNKQCVKKHGGSGRFSNLQSCQEHCSSQQSSYTYDCVGTGFGHGSGRQCVKKHGPHGHYPDMKSCQENCGGSPGVSYNCVSMGSGPGQRECVQVHGSGGRYHDYGTCKSHC
jgi:hypothetical protein